MLSQGVPMIMGGDEFLRTQHGNNNAWCQDNPIGWVDWSLQAEERRLPPVRPHDDRAAEGPSRAAAADVFHGRARRTCRRRSSGMASSRPSPTFLTRAASLAWALDGRRSDRPNLVDRDIYVAVNAWSEPLGFKIPAAPSGRPWRCAVDTALPSPEDIVEEDKGPRVPVLQVYRVQAHSLIILVSDDEMTSSPTRTRTLNLAVNSRSLYRLSYRGICR